MTSTFSRIRALFARNEKMNKKSSPYRATGWNSIFHGSVFALAVAGVGIWHVNANSVAGNAGWINAANGEITMDCDGVKRPYNPLEKVVFMNHPKFPCGTMVKVTDSASNRVVLASVADNASFFKPWHVADVSLAVAQALGIDPLQNGLAQVVITPLNKPFAGLWEIAPVRKTWGGFEGEVKPAELRALTQNLLGEIGHQVKVGKTDYAAVYAVGQVTLNRARFDYRQKHTVEGVVFDGSNRTDLRCQFSWTCDGKKDPSAEIYGKKRWNLAQNIARDLLRDVVPGKYRAMMHSLRNATHYYAPLPLSKAPYWVKGMRQVAELPVKLEHRFYEVPRLVKKIANKRKRNMERVKNPQTIADLLLASN